MKRVIDGVTYNTDTATLVAQSEIMEEALSGRPEERNNYRLYQTRGGAFFIHVHMETQRKTVHGEWEPVQRNDFEPVSPDYAQKWIMEGDVELLSDVFGEPPEAAEEAAPAATLYIRVPASLKSRLDRISKDEGVSLNAWTMRCVEKCANLDEVGICLGAIISTSMCLDSEPEAGAYSEAVIREMVEHMAETAIAAANALGWRGSQIEELATNSAGTRHYRSFQAYTEDSQETAARFQRPAGSALAGMNDRSKSTVTVEVSEKKAFHVSSPISAKPPGSLYTLAELSESQQEQMQRLEKQRQQSIRAISRHRKGETEPNE